MGKTLYQLRPDLFPGMMTDTERMLWGLFFEDLNKAQHG